MKKKAQEVNWDKHLFRASSFGMLMSGFSRGATKKQLEEIEELEAKKVFCKGLGKGDTVKLEKLLDKDNPNEKQLTQIKELEAKKVFVKGLTENQQSKLNELLKIRDKEPELSKGAKTYLRKLRREIKFNRRKELKSKFLRKGIELEEAAVTFLSLYHGMYFENNKDRIEDDYFSGETDIVEGWDTKVSWELDSLPDPEEPLPLVYQFQNRVYCRLNNADKWTTSAILLDITPHALKDKLYREGFEPDWAGKDLPTWRKLEIISFYTYTEEKFFEYMELFDCKPEVDDVKSAEVVLSFIEPPIEERIVEKTIYRDLDIEEDMIEVVKLSRQYLNHLDNLMKKN